MSGPGPTPASDAAAARAFVVNSLAARAQSVGEIERKLAARDVVPDVAKTVIEEAARLGYLDDTELADSIEPAGKGGGKARGHMLCDHHRPGKVLRNGRQDEIECGGAACRCANQDNSRGGFFL